MDEEGNKITVPKTVVEFSQTSPVILAGALDGRVCVYRTYGLEHGPVSDEDQVARIMSCITKEDFSTTKEKTEGEEAAQ